MMKITFRGFRAELSPYFSTAAIARLWDSYYSNAKQIPSAEEISAQWAEFFTEDSAEGFDFVDVLFTENGFIGKVTL